MDLVIEIRPKCGQGEVGFKNQQNLWTSFMDGPLDALLNFLSFFLRNASYNFAHSINCCPFLSREREEKFSRF